MRDLYRRNGIAPYQSDRTILERNLTGATSEVEAGRQILLHSHRKALYDRYHADLTLLAELRSALRLEEAPFSRADELGDFHVQRPADERAESGFGAEDLKGAIGGNTKRRGRLRRWAGRAAVLAALALLVSFQFGVDLPGLTVNGNPNGDSDDMAALVADGNRRFAVADMINVFDQPDRGSPVLDQLNRHDIVHIDAREDGWARLLNRGQEAYVEMRFLAARSDCRASGLARPESGAVLHAEQQGANRIRVRNDSARDALVKISNSLGASVATLYVRSHDIASYGKLPDGAFRFKYATGEEFSPYCGAFLTNMVAISAELPLRLPDGDGDEPVSYIIQGVAHGNFPAKRILLDAF